MRSTIQINAGYYATPYSTPFTSFRCAKYRGYRTQPNFTATYGLKSQRSPNRVSWLRIGALFVLQGLDIHSAKELQHWVKKPKIFSL